MQIVNVLEIIKGTLTTLESWIIYEEQLPEDVVEVAEKYFSDKIRERGGTEADIEIALEEGEWDNNNGYDIILTWSNINN